MFNQIEISLRRTPWPRVVVPLLPGSSRDFGPPRRWGLIRDVVPAAGGRVLEVEPSRILAPPPCAFCHGAMSVTGLEAFQPNVPATCVFVLDSVRAIGAEGFLVTEGDTFLYDATFCHNPHPTPDSGHPIYLRKKARPVVRLPGVCLSLATDFAIGSFSHFLHDGIARLRLMGLAGFKPAKADWIFCPHVTAPTAEVVCAGLGIAPNRVLNYSPDHDWEFETLVGTSYPAPMGTVPPENARYLRELGRQWQQGPRPPSRVWLSRRGFRRNPVNLDEIESILREFGFWIANPESGESILRACANAEIVAGIDGSNMAALAFAPAGARVLIVNPSHVPPLPYQTTMTWFGDRELHLVGGDPLPGETPSYSGVFLLPAGRLRACLAVLCPGRSHSNPTPVASGAHASRSQRYHPGL